MMAVNEAGAPAVTSTLGKNIEFLGLLDDDLQQEHEHEARMIVARITRVEWAW